MARGIKIKLRRQRGARQRRRDDIKIFLWTGTERVRLDSVPHPAHDADVYGEFPETVITPIHFPPLDALPPEARGYPRLLPQVFAANDNITKTSKRGRMNATKAILLGPTSDPTSMRFLPLRSKRPADRELTRGERIEARLTELSREYQRHIFEYTHDRIGYLDNSLRFVTLCDRYDRPLKFDRTTKSTIIRHADGRVGYLDAHGTFFPVSP